MALVGKRWHPTTERRPYILGDGPDRQVIRLTEAERLVSRLGQVAPAALAPLAADLRSFLVLVAAEPR